MVVKTGVVYDVPVPIAVPPNCCVYQVNVPGAVPVSVAVNVAEEPEQMVTLDAVILKIVLVKPEIPEAPPVAPLTGKLFTDVEFVVPALPPVTSCVGVPEVKIIPPPAPPPPGPPDS